MKNPEDFWQVLEVVPGAPLKCTGRGPDAFGCKLGDYMIVAVFWRAGGRFRPPALSGGGAGPHDLMV